MPNIVTIFHFISPVSGRSVTTYAIMIGVRNVAPAAPARRAAVHSGRDASPMNWMNRIGKRKLKNRSEHEADLPRKSAFAKSHPVNPVHPVQNVFQVPPPVKPSQTQSNLFSWVAACRAGKSVLQFLKFGCARALLGRFAQDNRK
jgi:hypothetical protein